MKIDYNYKINNKKMESTDIINSIDTKIEIIDTNIINFIDNIINFNNVYEILDSCNNQSQKGYVFERLWDILIKCGYCKKFPNSEYNHILGNINLGKPKTLKNLNKYFEEEKVISGNSGGCSDITLKNKDTKKFTFISSKFPKTQDDEKNEKSVDYYV